MFVELPIDEAYAPLYEAINGRPTCCSPRWSLAFLAGVFLARTMVVPIQALREGAARIGSGDLRAAHLDQDRRRARRPRQPVQRHGRRGWRNPTPTWKTRSSSAPASWRNRSASCARSAKSRRRSTRRSTSNRCSRPSSPRRPAFRHRRRRDLRVRRAARRSSGCAPPTA